jgi:hypothetical protein
VLSEITHHACACVVCCVVGAEETGDCQRIVDHIQRHRDAQRGVSVCVRLVLFAVRDRNEIHKMSCCC